jgi:hypothetical protein
MRVRRIIELDLEVVVTELVKSVPRILSLLNCDMV